MTKKNSLAFAALWAAVAISMFAPLKEIVRARGHKTPSSATGSSAADGAALYDGKCSLCQQIADSIKNGKGKFMPAFKGKLSDEETGAVVQRIRAFGKKK
jgi:hypothetical protein